MKTFRTVNKYSLKQAEESKNYFVENPKVLELEEGNGISMLFDEEDFNFLMDLNDKDYHQRARELTGSGCNTEKSLKKQQLKK